MTTITHKASRSRLRGEVTSQTDYLFWFHIDGDERDDSICLRIGDWILPRALPTNEGAVIAWSPTESFTLFARLTPEGWHIHNGAASVPPERLSVEIGPFEWVEYAAVTS